MQEDETNRRIYQEKEISYLMECITYSDFLLIQMSSKSRLHASMLEHPMKPVDSSSVLLRWLSLMRPRWLLSTSLASIMSLC